MNASHRVPSRPFRSKLPKFKGDHRPDPTPAELARDLREVAAVAAELANDLDGGHLDGMDLFSARRIAAQAIYVRRHRELGPETVVPWSTTAAWIDKRFERVTGGLLVCHACGGSFEGKRAVEGWRGYHSVDCPTDAEQPPTTS